MSLDSINTILTHCAYGGSTIILEHFGPLGFPRTERIVSLFIDHAVRFGINILGDFLVADVVMSEL